MIQNWKNGGDCVTEVYYDIMIIWKEMVMYSPACIMKAVMTFLSAI